MIKKISNKKAVAIALIIVFVICICSLSMMKNTYETFGKSDRKIPIYSVDRNDGYVALSFDCAWGTEYTDKILEVLETEEIKVTFFMTQFWVENNPEYVKKIYEKGHEIGSHSKTHGHMSKMSKEEVMTELQSSKKAIEDIIGNKVTLFRPPFGEYNNCLVESCTESGLYTIQWNVDSLDWKNLSAKDISLRIINKVSSGSIILCHNNGLHTAESLPIFISYLKNKGYKFVPIGQLIYKENYVVDNNGRQRSN